MTNSTIYSIGHGNKKIQDFLEELREFKIKYLVDVRSKPYSKYCPQFNKNDLKNFLENNSITYVYMGDSIGGLPNDLACYTEGNVDYEKLKINEFFRKGLERLVTAQKREIRLAVMCSESNPAECHRSKLIGRELLKENISMVHIIGRGKVMSQAEVMLEITEGKSETDLFGEETGLKSKKKYADHTATFLF